MTEELQVIYHDQGLMHGHGRKHAEVSFAEKALKKAPIILNSAANGKVKGSSKQQW